MKTIKYITVHDRNGKPHKVEITLGKDYRIRVDGKPWGTFYDTMRDAAAWADKACRAVAAE